MAKLLNTCSRLALIAPLALFMAAIPGQIDPSSGSIDMTAAYAAGPGGAGGGGDHGGRGGRGGRGGSGSGAAAGETINQTGVSASENDTAAAATNPETRGLSKAENVVGTTPASENGNALAALGDANSENGTDAESENGDFSLSKFGNQMSEDAKAAVHAIAGLFSGEEEE